MFADMPNFTSKIDWNDEVILKKILKEDCKCRPYLGIKEKRIQLMEFMTGMDLTAQLEFLARKEVCLHYLGQQKKYQQSITTNNQ